MEVILKKQRNTTIDLVKFICAFGVICIHTKNSTNSADAIGNFFLPFCVPFFFLTSLIFFISSFQNGNLYNSSRKTFGRIIIPYLTWTLIYTGLIFLKHLLNHNHQELVWWRILFFGESAVHLYFLPKLLVFETLALSIALIFSFSGRLKIIGFALALIPLSYFIIGTSYHCFGLNYGEHVTICIYLVLAYVISRYYKSIEVFPYSGMIGFVLLTIAAGMFYSGLLIQISGYSMNFIICSLSIIFIAIGLPLKNLPGWLATIFSLSYGIYLSHEVFIQGLEMLFGFLHFTVVYTPIIKILFASIVLSLSIAFTLIIGRFQFLKGSLLG